MKKAVKFYQIDQALRFNEPVAPDHEFFTPLSDVRGDYQEKEIFSAFGISRNEENDFFVHADNLPNKSILFLGGMRGSGKTTELAKYAQQLHGKDCYFVVTCNIDKELSLNDMEFMDILILMLEKLTEKLESVDVKIDKNAADSLKKWFQNKEKEINRSIKTEAELQLGIGKEQNVFTWLLGAFATLKMGVGGSAERKMSIRTALKNNFMDFAAKFNNYILEAASALQRANKAREVLFIVDGLEKTMSVELRRKIVIDEAMRLQVIGANIIYTLPIELMRQRQVISQYATNVISFPFIKVATRQGKPIEKSVERLRTFIYKRVDASLFADEEIINKAIHYSGGSPRELLRIIERASFLTDDKTGIIKTEALDEALKRLGNQTAQYITQKEWEVIEKIVKLNNEGREIGYYDDIIEDLLEKLIVMEYNDGTFKNINPVLRLSNIYKQKFGA